MGDAKEEVKLMALRCDRPKPVIDTVALTVCAERIYLPGRVYWQPLVIELYEYINGSTNETAKFFNLWGLGKGSKVYDIQKSQYGSISDFKKTVTIQCEDGGGEAVWTYDLLEAYPSEVVPSTLDYADSSLSNMAVTMVYSKAVEK